jgi:hypothetical protein
MMARASSSCLSWKADAAEADSFGVSRKAVRLAHTQEKPRTGGCKVCPTLRLKKGVHAKKGVLDF